eukprot:TRINITY_DN46401_c0_g1_i2.p1 TRINITY_DN46401_c0_g1~~TRINITY_DN46401_c0_g1_i2.p1  ORF type:complete len:394 (-),score=181.15 TRINITY_DN46401_c0_g1_i2:109-1290(-)
MGFNQFPQYEEKQDAFVQRKGKVLSTIYWVIFIPAVIFFTVDAASKERTFTLTDANPTLDTYNALYAKHEDSLSCPCKFSSVVIDEFVTMTQQRDIFCTSSTPNATSCLEDSECKTDTLFKGAIVAREQLCEVSKHLLDVRQQKLAASKYATPEVIPKQFLQEEITFMLLDELDAAGVQFSIPLRMGQTLLEIDTPFSISENEYTQFVDKENNTRNVPYVGDLWTEIQNENGGFCDCKTEPSCAVERTTNGQKWFHRCNTVFTVMTLPMTLISNTGVYDEAFNCSGSTHSRCTQRTFIFPTGSNFEDMQAGADSAFLNGWTGTVDFAAYYDACAPTKCTHTEVRKASFSEVFTIVMALIGGLASTIVGILGLVNIAWRGPKRQDVHMVAPRHT